MAEGKASEEDTYIEYQQDEEKDTPPIDTYDIYAHSNGNMSSDSQAGKNTSSAPVPKPRSKIRTKSYEKAVLDSDEDKDESEYLPMDRTSKQIECLSRNKPIPAPRPKDLSKKLAYEKERAESNMFKKNRSPLIPTRQAPSIPTKPAQEIIDKYFPSKSTEVLVDEKVTVIREIKVSDDSNETIINKVKERPRSSTWYDEPENKDSGELTDHTNQPDSIIPVINYVEISDQDKPRPMSAVIESEIKLPTKKKHSKSFLDTIRSWTGSSPTRTDKSPKNSHSSIRSSSKFYSDPDFLKLPSNKSESSNDPSKHSHSASSCTSNSTLQVPIPSPRSSLSTSSIQSKEEESPTSPAPPVPPPRLSRSKGSYEQGDSFEEYPVFTPTMPSSFSSDTGLDLLAKASRVDRMKSDPIPEEMAPEKPPTPKEPPRESTNDTSLSPVPHIPMLQPLTEEMKARLLRQVHDPVPEETHVEEFDSLDVFIPVSEVQHQRMSPRKVTSEAAVSVPHRLSKKKKVPSFDELDMVVHGLSDSSSNDDNIDEGYADPCDVCSADEEDSPRVVSNIATPPALPPRHKMSLKVKPAKLPPSGNDLDQAVYTNEDNVLSTQHEVKCSAANGITDNLSREYAEVNDSANSERTTTVSDDVFPPALPPRERVRSRSKPVPLPPSRGPDSQDHNQNANIHDEYVSLRTTNHQYEVVSERVVNIYSDSPTRNSNVFSRSHNQSNASCDSVVQSSSSVLETVVHDIITSVDNEPPPLPETSPPRDLPPHSDLDSSPERTFDTPTYANDKTSKILQISNDDSNGDCVQTVFNSAASPDACYENVDMSQNNDGLAIPIFRKQSDSSSSYTSDSDSDCEQSTSTTGDESDDETLHDSQSQCTLSGDTTPVTEHKSLLHSLSGDRASVATLTPHTSNHNSLDPLRHESTSSSSTSQDDTYEELPDDSITKTSQTNYLNEPVRLRRQHAVSSETPSLYSLSSSESSSRPASWASFASYGSSDYTPMYSPQISTLSTSENQRPMSGESGVASDMSMVSDSSITSGLSLSDSTYATINSGQPDCDISEEEYQTRKEEKRKKKQFFVAKEIMTSEQSFVDVLKLLNEDFRKVIGESSKAIRSPIVPPQVLNQILNHLPELQIFSEGLLHDLKQRIDNWENDPRIADIFVKKGPFLKLYTSYIMEYDSMCKTFDEARKKYSEFDKCTTIFEASTRCYKLTLRHYMMKPVQRIPQYRLLLLDYQKYLTPDSPDYEDTKAALKIVTEVAEHANQRMKYGENLSKLLEIQSKVIGRYELIKPGRSFVKEGMLNKVSRKEKQPRMFFLMNDVLLYTAPYTYKTYQLKNVLPLVGMRVRLSDDPDDDYKNEFSIISTQRSFALSAETEEEKNDWVTVLREIIAENNEKRKTFVPNANLGKPVVSIKAEHEIDFKLGTRHPVWIPDDRVSMCMLCSAEFTLIFRRHHCRACGRVVCLFCSDYQAPLRYLQNKPSRVCKTCYSKLKKEVRSSVISMGAGVKEGEESQLGLLSMFSKSANTLRRNAHKQFHRVSNLRDSFGTANKKKKSKALTEVSANDRGATMSGYLKCWKDKKWVKHWYVVKGNVLYKFKGSEDSSAAGSTVLLGYEVRPFSYSFQGVEANRLFELIHKGMPSLMFRTMSQESRDKWMKALITATVP